MRISTKCSIAVHCLMVLHASGGKQKVTSGLLALSTGCNPVVIRGVMSALRKAGIIRAREGGGTELAQAPEAVDLYQIWSAVEPEGLRNLIGIHPKPSKLCPVGRSMEGVLEACYERVRADFRESLRKVTLADFAEEYRRRTEG